MTLMHGKYRTSHPGAHRDLLEKPNAWRFGPSFGQGYDHEDELLDHLSKLPPPSEVEELMGSVQVVILRKLAADVVNGGIAYVTGSANRVEYARLLNSWIATAEEAVAAGQRLRRIAARRKQS